MSQCEDRSPGEEDVAMAVEREMDKMESAIKDAVERFTAMLENSRAKDTGTQLEVRSSKLQHCYAICHCIYLALFCETLISKW